MTKQGWQKILYRHQPYPDNYSGGDEQFLKELRKNVSVVHYSYKDALTGSFIFLSHIDVVTMYFILFLNTLHSNWSPTVLYSVFFSIIPCYLFYCKSLEKHSIDVKNHGRTIISLFMFAFAFTPVIRTLTTSISTDTIYATAIISAVLSCIFHDYGVKAPIVSYPISMSSGLCSSIFLLSRLEEDLSAFLLLVIAFVIHAYGADFRNQLISAYPTISTLIFACLSLSTFHFIKDFSIELMIFSMFSHIFILFVCPLILIYKQTGKCTIHGPWDEAVPVKTS